MTGRTRGFTLLEMIVVITIFAMMLGLTVALLKGANKDLGVSAGTLHVVTLLRAAHAHARANSSPAWVVFRTKENAVSLVYKETVGEWHFEDDVTTGAFGKNGRVSNASLVNGRVGQGLKLGGSATVDCGEIPVYAPDQGIAIEFWFLRKGGRAAHQVMCSIGKEVEVSVEGDGRVDAHVGNMSVSSKDVRVPLDTWCFLQVVSGVGELKLFLNDQLADARAGTAEWTRNSPLVVGDSKSGFGGVIDEFRVGLVLAREEFPLAGECRFEFSPPAAPDAQTGVYVLHFDTEGRLDPAKHKDPVKFAVVSAAAKKEIEVGLGGTVQR